MNDLKRRKPNRLKGYNYSSNGAYFITICVKDMKCILSSVVGADDLGSPTVKLKPYGKVVEENLSKMNMLYDNITVDKYVIMPNHIHILLSIQNERDTFNGAPRSSPPTNTLSKFVSAFKKYTNKEFGNNIWQRGFHDHIIRDEQDYLILWQYVDENPRKWLIGKDKYYSL